MLPLWISHAAFWTESNTISFTFPLNRCESSLPGSTVAEQGLPPRRTWSWVPGCEKRQGTEAMHRPEFRIGLQHPDVVYPTIAKPFIKLVQRKNIKRKRKGVLKKRFCLWIYISIIWPTGFPSHITVSSPSGSRFSISGDIWRWTVLRVGTSFIASNRASRPTKSD